MKTTSQAPQVDPAELARLVLRLREFRAELDGMLASLPARSETPFLYRQLEEQIDALQSTLRSILEEKDAVPRREKRRGLLGRVLGGRQRDGRVRHPDLEGNSWTIPVPELVGFLSSARKTGVLWVDSKDENTVLEFRDGKLVRATSDHTPDRLRLGELLVRHGALGPHDVREVVQDAKRHDLSLGAYLIESGRVTERAVEEALSEQVQGLFYRLMKTGNAIYRFQEGLDTAGAMELELNVTSLLLEGARKQDEESRPLPAAIEGPLGALSLEEPSEAAETQARDEREDGETESSGGADGGASDGDRATAAATSEEPSDGAAATSEEASEKEDPEEERRQGEAA